MYILRVKNMNLKDKQILIDNQNKNIPRCCIKECDLFYERMCR